jgi:gliding motility-associated-like protein
MLRTLIALSLPIFLIWGQSNAQKPEPSHPATVRSIQASRNVADAIGVKSVFIANKGQYGDTIPGFGYMGKILYGYEGWGLPVFFTSRGLIHLHVQGRDARRFVTMKWLNANPHPQILAADPAPALHNYANGSAPARAFGKLIYKNIYPGIDIEYSFIPGNRTGFEYRMIIHPGADASQLRLQYGGDIRNVKDSIGNLVVNSGMGCITESAPVSYYADERSNPVGKPIESRHVLKGKARSFLLPGGYDHHRRLVIDPFLSSTASALTGLNAGKVMQVDYDYSGDVYVQGGTNEAGQIAKFDPAGNLLWRFASSVPGINWTYGDNFGGWAVEKTTGNVYVGQGSRGYGCSIIRLNGATGAYDNYHTPDFADGRGRDGEIWKMRWLCNGGAPEVMIAGGSGGVGDFGDNIGILLLPSTRFTSYNVTGITTYPYNQDVSDFVLDPANNDLYCILASGNTPFVNNRIYKNTFPYIAANQQWNTLSGSAVLHEDDNNPFMAMSGDMNDPGDNSNATNILAVSSGYLFYYDGRILKAFNKATGATAGTPVTFPWAALMQTGIYADECSNVYIGSPDGTIKVFHFNGGNFDDNAVADIPIPGYAGKAVYALTYDPTRNLLYAGGDGFVASFDLSGYCAPPPPPPSVYSIALSPGANSVTASVTPAPPTGAVVTYTLLQGTTVMGSNATGVFTNLDPQTNYTLRADIVLGCADALATTHFQLKMQMQLKETDVCGTTGGTITATLLGGAAPYTYSKNGIDYQQSNIFTELLPGDYTIVAMEQSGDTVMRTVSVAASDLAVAAGKDTTICEGTTAQMHGSTNATDFSWSPSAGLSSTTITDPQVAPVGTTTYYLTATRGNCTLTASTIVQVLAAPTADAGKDTSLCFGTNGILRGSGGGSYSWTPSTFLDNDTIAEPVVSQASHSVIYTLQVTDASGCRSLRKDSVLLKVIPPARLSAGRDTVIAINEPLQLLATDVNQSGFDQYTWSPSVGLNDPLSQHPVALLENSVTYGVRAMTPEGCVAEASVEITVYKGPDIYLPNSFTPNGDGHNDVLRIRMPGIPTLRYFTIFNRWGQEVFHTTNPSTGWDGRLNGTALPAGVFVWMVEAVDYSGKLFQRKGTILLIR